jgi:hypothetical protein
LARLEEIEADIAVDNVKIAKTQAEAR